MFVERGTEYRRGLFCYASSFYTARNPCKGALFMTAVFVLGHDQVKAPHG
jgi:hypothetical protein